MEKLSINIDPEQWGNLITKYQSHSPNLKETDFSGGTVNLDTDTNGSLTKRKGGPNYNTALLAAAPKDQYEAIFSDGARHLLVVANGEIKYSSGDTIFNPVANGSGFNAGANFEFATTQDRVYGCNKINSPQVYDRIASYGGATPVTVPRLKTMGCQIPVSAPTVAVAAGGAVPVGIHRYKVTFVYYDSQESNGGPASATATTTAGNQTVNLTAIPVGGYGVSQRGIYRDNNDGNYTLITYLTDNTTVAYSDTLAIGATPTPIPTNNGTPPIFGLISLWIDRLWLSQVPGDPYTLFYSEASQPDIYGSENQILCNQEDPITATIVYFDRLMVFNRRSFGQIIGSTPESFRYAAIPSSVGCVDNRTLQIHVLQGVPVLMWLSERGFYTYDGNAIEYISNVIEDLVNYNIRQAIQQKNANAQTSFLSGTPSNGVDTTQLSSLITTKGYLDGTATPGNNPRRRLDDQSDWENSLARSNVSTKNGPLYKCKDIFFGLNNGTHDGTIYSGGNVTLPAVSTLASESIPNGTLNYPSAVYKYVALKLVAGATGTVSYADINSARTNPVSIVSTQIFSHNAGADEPLAALGNVGSVVVTAGTIYWLVRTYTGPGQVRQGSFFPSSSGIRGRIKQSSGGWSTASLGLDGSYSITTAPTSISGTYTTVVYDTYSDCAITRAISLTSSYPSGTSSITWLEGSDDPLFLAGAQVSFQANNLGGALVALSNKRYWRMRVYLATTSNIYVPTVSSIYLSFGFGVTASWTSELIDCTADVTVYNSLTVSEATPLSAPLTLTVASSNDGLSFPDGFVAFGSVVVRRYLKIKVDFSTSTSQALNSLELKWTVVSNFLSPIIDTGVAPPAGWDVFLAQYSLNGGSVQFQMRSAATSGAIPAAIFYNVTPSEFPTVVAPLQFTQWKVILTSTDLQVPSVDSVTVQWFIGVAESVRPASIFVDGRYYVALAELNQTVNNLILQLDLNGKWRRFKGLSIATFSFFFNRPYFGLATAGQIRKFLEGTTDAGVAIEYDVRTKAFDFSTSYREVADKQKIVGEVIVHMSNTGAAIQLMYSVDEGENFYPLYTLAGATSYQTAASGPDVFVRFKPSWTNGNPIHGQHLMYRIYNNDIYNVEVHSIKMTALVRKQPPVITG